MKRTLLLVLTYLSLCKANSQQLSADDFLFSSSFTPKKLEAWLSKKKFQLSSYRIQRDTSVNVYILKPEKKKSKEAPVTRIVETYQWRDNFCFAFFTSSQAEFAVSISTLKDDGFFCGDETSFPALFQQKTISVSADKVLRPGGDTLYTFFFTQAKLPPPGKVQFAEDLLQFNSHEELVSVFGEKNVVKDVYYFSEKEASKCSVLFPRTNRQAVFIWEDEVNLRHPSYVLIGGNIGTASSANYNGLVEENVWSSKDGIYSGMSLSSLIRLNGKDFRFYGTGTKFPFMVVPEKTGAVNFKKSIVVLGCLNPTASKLLNKEVISADEIIDYNPGLYVLTIMFSLPATTASR
jgi:hypothetical protein